ncbi:3-hydroxymethylcephem carbamoyltransferase (plasmid) [Streptomyces sp. NBC_01527]|uniref:carbamoyltransferase C-terminal domain-containing protein n=2 Tax=Streptomyces TaxID=1883 RepID=UPI002F90AFAB|nr:3-hydroxymethylcephem carbamoyltransferase [Streptomyces sp. NBC_01230]
MLIVAFKPGHDGCMAVIRDGKLLYSLESEKDSFARYSFLTPTTVLELAERLDEMPDVVAVGGWQETGINIRGSEGAGYIGTDSVILRESKFFGKKVQYFSSSHERSHIMGGIGMAPPKQHPLQAVLVWEGLTGKFFLVDDEYRIVRTIPVMDQPGAKYAALFAICDPTFPATGSIPRLSDAGKLMALAAHADHRDADSDITAAIDRLLKTENVYPVPKEEFRDTPLFDCGVTSTVGTTAAALLTERVFRAFADIAIRELPQGIPLSISGGCGLNCDWNAEWADLGHFSEVFVPPCANDTGSAIGTAVDAQMTLTGSPHISWNVYSGLEFVRDQVPDPARWSHRSLDHDALSAALSAGRVAAWVQGRWEIGPRALGNRSLLADAFSAASKDRLNEIKQREDYRPIAPCARVEDLATAFDRDFEDPYMLYFRRVRDTRLKAVTHVDGSARVQTVSEQSNAALHRLLGAVAAQKGTGVLCNTSLNFNGHGFINRTSDLVAYCEARGVSDMVIGNDWYQQQVL